MAYYDEIDPREAADRLEDQQQRALPADQTYDVKMKALEQMLGEQQQYENLNRDINQQETLQKGAANILGAWGKYGATPTYSNIVTGTQMPDYSQQMQQGMMPTGDLRQDINQRMQRTLEAYKAKAAAEDVRNRFKQAMELKGMEQTGAERLENMKQRGQMDIEKFRAGIRQEKEAPEAVSKEIQNKEAVLPQIQKFRELTNEAKTRKTLNSPTEKLTRFGVGFLSGLPWVGNKIEDPLEEALYADKHKEFLREKTATQMALAAAEGNDKLPREQIIKMYDPLFPTDYDDAKESNKKINEIEDRLKTAIKAQREHYGKTYKIPETAQTVRAAKEASNKFRSQTIPEEELAKYRIKYPNATDEQITQALLKRGMNTYATK